MSDNSNQFDGIDLSNAQPVLMECGPDGLSERTQEILMEHLLVPAISGCGIFGSIQAANFFIRAAALTLCEYVNSQMPSNWEGESKKLMTPKMILQMLADGAPDGDEWEAMNEAANTEAATIASLDSILAATEAAELAAKSEGLEAQDDAQAEADRLAGEAEAERRRQAARQAEADADAAALAEYEATWFDADADESTRDEGDADPVTPDEGDARDEHDPTL